MRLLLQVKRIAGDASREFIFHRSDPKSPMNHKRPDAVQQALQASNAQPKQPLRLTASINHGAFKGYESKLLIKEEVAAGNPVAADGGTGATGQGGEQNEDGQPASTAAAKDGLAVQVVLNNDGSSDDDALFKEEEEEAEQSDGSVEWEHVDVNSKSPDTGQATPGKPQN